MKDFPPDGTKVRLSSTSTFLNHRARGAMAIFSRNDPHWNITETYGYVKLTPPITGETDYDTIESQVVHPQDIELTIPIARTHQVRPAPHG